VTTTAPGRLPVRRLWVASRETLGVILHAEPGPETTCARVACVATPMLVPVLFELTVRHPALALLPVTPFLIGSIWYLLATKRSMPLRPVAAWGTLGLMGGAVLVMGVDVVLGTRGISTAVHGAADLLVSGLLTGVVAASVAFALRWAFGGR
jgi:hypothetical protein